MVFFFEELFGTGFVVGSGVESVLVGVGAGRGVASGNVLIAVFGESGLFGGSEARSFGAIKDEDSGVFVDFRIAGEHFSNVFLNSVVVAGTTDRNDIGNTVDGSGGHVIFGLDEGDLTHVVKVEFGSEVGNGFELVDGEVGGEIIAESIKEAEKIGNG